MTVKVGLVRGASEMCGKGVFHLQICNCKVISETKDDVKFAPGWAVRSLLCIQHVPSLHCTFIFSARARLLIPPHIFYVHRPT